jgi:Tfp pilus assembly protein PilF
MGNTVLYGKLPTPPIESTGYTSVPLSGIDAEVAIADMHFHSRDYSNKASAEYEAILKRQPDNVRANRGLGYARMMHGDIEAAEPYLARAAAADQKDPMVHYYYAMLLARRLGDEEGVREKILAQAQIATRLNPELADAYNLMAVMYSHEHQFDQAEEALSKAIKLKPQDDNYKANLAGFYMQQEKFDEAKALLAKLQSSSNPSIAIMAQRNLEAIDREKESNSALLVRTVESSDRAAEKPILRESGVRTAPAREPQPEEESPAAPPPPKEPPVAYVRGMLTSSVCGSPEATLTVVTDRKKTLKLRTQDWKKMVVFGADQFSCEWKNKRISVNYRPLSGPDADGAIVGMSLLE